VPKSAKQPKILLVEDDPFLYKVLSQRLRDEGMDVTVSTDGESAIADASRVKPNLILLDLILPKLSGFEVLAHVRKMPATTKVPVVVLSNLGQQEDIDQIEKLGVREYLVKADYSLSEMVKKVKEHVAAVLK